MYVYNEDSRFGSGKDELSGNRAYRSVLGSLNADFWAREESCNSYTCVFRAPYSTVQFGGEKDVQRGI